jgi:tellurite methyltransferase
MLTKNQKRPSFYFSTTFATRQPLTAKACFVEVSVYTFTMAENETWKQYGELSKLSPPRERLVQALATTKLNPEIALDFGCGSGRDSRYLLSQGWKVDSLDADKSSLLMLEEICDAETDLKTIHTCFQNVSFLPDRYALINASYSMPFCEPSYFQQVWTSLQC